MAILARLGTSATQDAGVHSDVEDRVAIVDGFALARLPPGFIYVVMIRGDRKLLEVAGAILNILTDHRQRQLYDAATNRVQFRSIGPDLHAIRCRSRTRSRVSSDSLDLHQAGPTCADGLHVRVFAKLRDVGSRDVDHVQNRRALGGVDLVGVYRKGDTH